MVGADEARELGTAACTFDEVVLGTARELEHGWHFPLIGKRTKACTGVIVNKQTGVALLIVLHSALEDDPTLYDRGFQSTTCDVVVSAVQDLAETMRVLHTIGDGVVETYYGYDRVRRHRRRRLTDDEVRDRLSALPAVFTGDATYYADEFETARENDWFTYELLEHRPRT